MTTAVDTVAPGSDPEGLDRFRTLEARQQPVWPDAAMLSFAAVTTASAVIPNSSYRVWYAADAP